MRTRIRRIRYLECRAPAARFWTNRSGNLAIGRTRGDARSSQSCDRILDTG